MGYRSSYRSRLPLWFGLLFTPYGIIIVVYCNRVQSLLYLYSCFFHDALLKLRRALITHVSCLLGQGVAVVVILLIFTVHLIRL